MLSNLPNKSRCGQLAHVYENQRNAKFLSQGLGIQVPHCLAMCPHALFLTNLQAIEIRFVHSLQILISLLETFPSHYSPFP
jgi:hypothetical protein